MGRIHNQTVEEFNAKKKKELLFLKKLDETGYNVQISESQRELVEINEDLEKAIKQDLLSDEDVIGENGNKRKMTDKEKRDKYI